METQTLDMAQPWPKHGERQADYSVLVQEDVIRTKPDECVYFFGSPDGAHIKIGYASGCGQLRQRLNAASGAGHTWEILALIRATKHDEGRIHTYFKSYQAIKGKTETYETESVLSYLIWLRDLYFVADSIDSFENDARTRQVIASEHWLPTTDRVSTKLAEPNLLSALSPWNVLPTREITVDDYYTPPKIIECARAALGTIDLDPASHVVANEVVKAQRFYTVSENGLTLPWYGSVWLNPPFSKYDQFINKIIQEIDAGRIEQIIALVATRTMSARYFDKLLRRVNTRCTMTGRHTGWGAKGEASSPPDGYETLYWGEYPERFASAFKELGTVWSIRDCRSAADLAISKVSPRQTSGDILK